MATRPSQQKSSPGVSLNKTAPSGMPRSAAMLTTVVVLVILAGGVYAAWKYFPGFFGKPKPDNTSALSYKLINVDLNANTTPPVITAQTEVKGDTLFTGTVEVNGVAVKFSSLQRQDTVDKVAAAAGKTWLFLYFDGVAPADADKVSSGLLADAQLRSGTTVIPLLGIQVATTNIKNNRGYLKYQVPVSANLQLNIGSGANTKRFSIP